MPEDNDLEQEKWFPSNSLKNWVKDSKRSSPAQKGSRQSKGGTDQHFLHMGSVQLKTLKIFLLIT